MKIEIGQQAIGGMPYGEPFIQFIVGDSYTLLRLKDLQNWINEICDSNGDRNKKAYEAKDKLEELFSEIISLAIGQKSNETV